MSAEDAVVVIGKREALLMKRARAVKRSWRYRVANLVTQGERERLAARRLVERGLLVHHFPAAGPGHPLRKYYSLTLLGRTARLMVR